MAVLLPNAGPSEYVPSGFDRPPAIVQPSCGPSPLGSDPHEAFVASMNVVLDQVESRLLAWFRKPDAFADDETDAPSHGAIRSAMHFVQWIKRDASRLPENLSMIPLRGASIGSAGAVSLEFARTGLAVTYAFEPDGSAEKLVFEKGRLRSREPFFLPAG